MTEQLDLFGSAWDVGDRYDPSWYAPAPPPPTKPATEKTFASNGVAPACENIPPVETRILASGAIATITRKPHKIEGYEVVQYTYPGGQHYNIELAQVPAKQPKVASAEPFASNGVEPACETEWQICVPYPAGGRKYFRWMHGKGHRVLNCRHIPGGNINSPIARGRARCVEQWIAAGRSPEEIRDAIAGWSRTRLKSKT